MTKPGQEASVSNTVLLSIYKDLSGHRAVFDRGLAKFRISAKDLQDVDGQIELRSFVQMLEWLAQQLDDPNLGLKLSQRAGPAALGPVGYLFLSSGDIETALQSMIQYLEAVQGSTSLEIRYLDDFLQISYRIEDDSIAPRRQDSEYSIGIMWHYICLLSANRCRLAQVSFEHGRRGSSGGTYRRIFGAPVLFHQEANALILPLEAIRESSKGMDPQLIPILENHITNIINRSRQPDTFAETVTQVLTEPVLQQGARARLIAGRLKISTVTLHRRLRTEDVRFRQLVDQRSKDVARRLLRHSNTPIATISYRLGFSDPAAFSRAFRRWFGSTPRDFRANNRIAGS